MVKLGVAIHLLEADDVGVIDVLEYFQFVLNELYLFLLDVPFVNAFNCEFYVRV